MILPKEGQNINMILPKGSSDRILRQSQSFFLVKTVVHIF